MPENTPAISSWPPPYSVRVSKRAKYARLRISPGKGLEVILPHAMRHSSPDAIIGRHKEWIGKTLDRIGALANESPLLPEGISLLGGSVEFPVAYGASVTGLNNGTVSVKAEREDRTRAAGCLRTWLREYALEVLGREVAQLAAVNDCIYSGLRFRVQKSRWGSCSAKKALSLNLCLVFLPVELSRHVILHELAHTKHMNHGQDFWKTLFQMEENALALDKRLRTAWKFVPAWVWL